MLICSNPECEKPLTGGIDTFGEPEVPVCQSCWLAGVDKYRILAQVARAVRKEHDLMAAAAMTREVGAASRRARIVRT